MKNYSYTPQGVCSRKITFALDEAGKLHDVKFTGGCPGNLLAIGKLVEGAALTRRPSQRCCVATTAQDGALPVATSWRSQ